MGGLRELQRSRNAYMWTKIKKTGQRSYYVNYQTNETTWEKPEELFTALDKALAKTPWKQYETEDGREYWYNEITQQSTWEYPLEKIAQKDTPEELIKKILQKNSNKSFQEVIPQLVKFEEYWQLGPTERFSLMQQLNNEAISTKEKEYQEMKQAKTTRIKAEAANGYLSAHEALKLADGDKNIVNETLVQENLLVDFSPQIKGKIATGSILDKDWDSVELKIGKQLNYPRDPRIIDIYKSVLEEVHNQQLDALRAQQADLKIEAARARVQFISKLETLDITTETLWMDIVPKMEAEIIKLSAYPGSTPLDLFFWHKDKISQSCGQSRAEMLIKEANKRPDQVTFEEFKKITGVEDIGVYQKMKKESYTNARERLREKGTEQAAKYPAETILEYY